MSNTSLLPLLSSSERQFILQGVASGVRSDGRGRLDARDIILETGLLPQANGSARVIIGNTDILVGIKADLGLPSQQNPDQGRIHCNVECTATVTNAVDSRDADSDAETLGHVITRIFVNSGCIDLKKLCLIPGSVCWNFYIDAMILGFDGNAADAIAQAVRAAFSDLRIPRVVIDTGSTPPTVEIDEDLRRAFCPVDVAALPLSMTMWKVGMSFLVDPTPAEEACASGALLVAATATGRVCLVQTLAGGAAQYSESAQATALPVPRGESTGAQAGAPPVAVVSAGGMNPHSIVDMLSTATEIAQSVARKQDEALRRVAEASTRSHGAGKSAHFVDQSVGFFADSFAATSGN